MQTRDELIEQLLALAEEEPKKTVKVLGRYYTFSKLANHVKLKTNVGQAALETWVAKGVEHDDHLKANFLAGFAKILSGENPKYKHVTAECSQCGSKLTADNFTRECCPKCGKIDCTTSVLLRGIALKPSYSS